jgi:hypothetical protein
MTTLSASGNGTTSPRRHRYNRSSTTSVTQLLSDGYSSIMNRLTRRGPSEKSDIADAKLSAARSRYDDKPLSNKNNALSSVRRYENARHISPYAPLSTSLNSSRKLNEDRTYSSYLGSAKSRLDNSPLHTSSSLSALGRSDSFRRAHNTKDSNLSPFTKRYPLKETNNNIDSTMLLGSTRTRLEDKYSSVLDRIAVQKKERAKREKEDRDKTLEPEPPRGLMRSFTTAVFGESSFKRNHYSREKTRDKTPFRNTADRRLKDKEEHKNGYDIPLRDRPYVGKDRDSVYRRHHRRSHKPEKSENNDRTGKLSLHPIDIDIQSGVRDLISPLNGAKTKTTSAKTPVSSPIKEIGRQRQIYFPTSDEDDDKTPVGDRILSERETRRKEIQSLIMKYAHLDEVYGRIGEKEGNGTTSETVATKKPEPLGVGDLVALPPELRSRHRPQRPRHLLRRANTPPVSTS